MKHKKQLINNCQIKIYFVCDIPFQIQLFNRAFSVSLVDVIPSKSKQGREAYQRMEKRDDSATFLSMRAKTDLKFKILDSVMLAVKALLVGLSRTSMVLLASKLNSGLELVMFRMDSKFLGRLVPTET